MLLGAAYSGLFVLLKKGIATFSSHYNPTKLSLPELSKSFVTVQHLAIVQQITAINCISSLISLLPKKVHFIANFKPLVLIKKGSKIFDKSLQRMFFFLQKHRKLSQ